MDRHNLRLLVIVLLAAGGVLALAACVASTTPTPTPTPTPSTPTSTPLPSPTPTLEWGIAYAALKPLMVGNPTEGNLTLSLHLIRRDGSGLQPLTGEMEYVTNLTASPDGRYLLFSARREDTTGDHCVNRFDLAHLYAVEVQSGKVFTLTSGIAFTERWGGAWSPDGERIAFAAQEANATNDLDVRGLTYHLCVMNRDGTSKTCLPRQEGIIWTVAWSPTGEQILFEQNVVVWVVNADGSGLFKVADAPLMDWLPYTAQPAWSPDGRRIAFVAPGVGEDGWGDIFVVNADGSGLHNLTEDPDDDFLPTWSPDGQHIAFVTTRRGNWAIYAVDPSGGDSVEVFYSPDTGAEFPVWSPDGLQIVFVIGSSEIWQEQLFVVNWTDGSSYPPGEEYIGDRPAWVLLPTFQKEE